MKCDVTQERLARQSGAHSIYSFSSQNTEGESLPAAGLTFTTAIPHVSSDKHDLYLFHFVGLPLLLSFLCLHFFISIFTLFFLYLLLLSLFFLLLHLIRNLHFCSSSISSLFLVSVLLFIYSFLFVTTCLMLCYFILPSHYCFLLCCSR